MLVYHFSVKLLCISYASFVFSGMSSLEVQEDLREAANNLVKHFHKPEQEVRYCDEEIRT